MAELAVEHAKTVNFFRYEALEVCSYVRCLNHNAYLGYVDFLGFSGNISPNVRILKFVNIIIEIFLVYVVTSTRKSLTLLLY